MNAAGCRVDVCDGKSASGSKLQPAVFDGNGSQRKPTANDAISVSATCTRKVRKNHTQISLTALT